MAGATFPVQANGSISTCRFIKIDTSGDFLAIQATDGSSSHGDIGIGISTDAAQAAPFGTNDTHAALAGDQFEWHGIGATGVLLKIGSGGVTRGDLLKSDASGQGITSSTTGDNVLAIAEESAAAGEFGRVTIISPLVHV